jgi:isopentenyl-diphosphate Delta-isomerase
VGETIDALSADGTPTGAISEKADVHRDGIWHRAAHVWIVTPSRFVLLQRRSLAKENFPGLWDVSAAGHVAAGETGEDAAVRETLEEIGIGIARSDLARIGTIREQWALNDGTYLDNEIHDVFLVTIDVRPDELVLQLGEVDEVVLVHVDTLRRHVENRDPSLVPHWEEYDLLLRILDRDE